MDNLGCTSGLRRTYLIAVMAAASLIPRLLSATPDIPSGIGPLPDVAAGAKVGAIVSAQRTADYRKILPPEISSLVESGELVFEAALNPATKEISEIQSTPSNTPPEVGARGDLSPLPVSVSGPLFAVEGVDDARAISTRGYQVMWNTATTLWRERSLAADISATIFKAGMNEFKRTDFAIERIYPAALGVSPGTLAPLFREKISGRSPHPIAGLTWLTLRFLGSSVEDYLWAASPVTGDVMQMTGSNRGDSFFTDAFSPDDLFVWSGKVEAVEPIRVSEATVLVPILEGVVAATSSSKGECSVVDLSKASPVQLNAMSKRFSSASPWVPTSLRFVPRSIIRVEVISRDPYSKDAHQVLYIDTRSSLPVYRMVYGQDSRLRKIVIGFLGALPSESGSQLAWRGEVIVNAETGGRTVIGLNRYERCSSFVPGRAVIDFDPSRIGSKQGGDSKKRASATPTPAVEAEPVDE